MADHFWRNKKVFVTGATGFLGSWLTAELIKRGASVVALIRDRIPESNFNLMGLGQQATIINGSVADSEVVSRAFQEYEIEYCFHVAAQAIVGFANQDPLATFESNIKGTWVMLEAARRAPTLKGMVVASSDKAYGTQQIPYREDAPLLGRNPYDVSKVCTDQLTRCYGKTLGLPVAVTRCSNLFGGGDLNFSRVIPGTVRSLLLEESPIIRSDGSPVRDYLYVPDAVKGYLMLGERVAEKQFRGEAFNFGTATPVSVLDLVKRIIQVSGKRHLSPTVLGKGKMPGEIDQQYLDIEKAKKWLGWAPAFSLEEALRKTFQWYQKFFESHKSFVVEAAL